MKAIAKKTVLGAIKAGEEYPYIETIGSNIIIDVDGIRMGFTDTYLKLPVLDTERRKTLADERSDLDRQISVLKKRLSEVDTQIADIDNGLVNQLSIEL